MKPEKEKIIPMGIYIGKIENRENGERVATLNSVKTTFLNEKCSSEDIFSIPTELRN